MRLFFIPPKQATRPSSWPSAPTAKPRVLLTASNGRAAIYTITSNVSGYTEQSFGPYGDWTARDVAVGTDNKVRVTWISGSNQLSIFRISSVELDLRHHLPDRIPALPTSGWP